MKLDLLTENCYVRVVPVFFIGLIILLPNRDRDRVKGHSPSTLLERMAMTTSMLAAAIILSLIAFHYPKSHEGMKKHVLVFLTHTTLIYFAQIIGASKKGIDATKTASLTFSTVVATVLCAIDAGVWWQHRRA